MGRRGKPFARVEAPTNNSEFYGRDEVTRHQRRVGYYRSRFEEETACLRTARSRA